MTDYTAAEQAELLVGFKRRQLGASLVALVKLIKLLVFQVRELLDGSLKRGQILEQLVFVVNLGQPDSLLAM